MMACSEMSYLDEKFKLEVKLAWTDEYRLIEDGRDLRDVFLVFRYRGLKVIRMHMESLPLTAVLPPSNHVPHLSNHVPHPYEPSSQEEEPHESYSTNQSMPNFVRISSSEKDNNHILFWEKRKFEVGSSSNQPQKKKKKTVPAPPLVLQPLPTSQPQPQKKKKKQTVPAQPPASQPELVSQSFPVSQPL
ncbi:hypothetical protein ACOSQ3_029541 [Xanthoceras sorbifolium]